MTDTAPPPSATPGTLHHIPPISAFEPTPRNPTAPNILLWIGGLYDTYHSVAYPYTLSARLPPTWRLAQASLSSAAQGWGMGSLGQDVDELSKIVGYFRREQEKAGEGRGRIVLMGHSTGCQDCMHYVTSADAGGAREKIDGIILQAPVSDAEAIASSTAADTLAAVNGLAGEYVRAGRGEEVLPFAVQTVLPTTPICARRWLSLSSPEGKGEDDYFSSSLPDERLMGTFGRVDVPLLIMFGGKDECVPKHIDGKAIVARWIKTVKDAGAGPVDKKSAELLPGASHNLNGDPSEVVDELCARVVNFLTACSK